MTTPFAVRARPATTTIAVVDRQASDYVELLALAGAEHWTIAVSLTGRAGMQLARRECADLWMINARLPDMCGFDLVEMLRPYLAGTPMFLVGDAYRVEDELRALRLGVTKYLCKPFHACWLRAWRPAGKSSDPSED